MSAKHPIISVTGSSGAGTPSVRRTFEQIFRREKISAVFIEGDAFHRYDRAEMEQETDKNLSLSHFGEEANLLDELEMLFKTYGEIGTGSARHYVHDAAEATLYGVPPGQFTAWEEIPYGTDLMIYEGLHGASITDRVNVAPHPDLKISVVPV